MEYSGRFLSAQNERLQPLDENGRALPTKPTGHYDLAWPIQMGGTAWGYTYVAREKLTVGRRESCDIERTPSKMAPLTRKFA